MEYFFRRRVNHSLSDLVQFRSWLDDEQHWLYASMYVDIMGKCLADSVGRDVHTHNILYYMLGPFAQSEVQIENKFIFESRNEIDETHLPTLHLR